VQCTVLLQERLVIYTTSQTISILNRTT
jgi:hypothetical protein